MTVQNKDPDFPIITQSIEEILIDKDELSNILTRIFNTLYCDELFINTKRSHFLSDVCTCENVGRYAKGEVHLLNSYIVAKAFLDNIELKLFEKEVKRTTNIKLQALDIDKNSFVGIKISKLIKILKNIYKQFSPTYRYVNNKVYSLIERACANDDIDFDVDNVIRLSTIKEIAYSMLDKDTYSSLINKLYNWDYIQLIE